MTSPERPLISKLTSFPLLSIITQTINIKYCSEKYSQIMKLIWQALDNPARTWKLLFKTLTLIQFLIKNGNERVVEECRDHLHQIRPLQDYNYYEASVDKGSGVRDLSKAVVELLASNDAIRSEREKARQLRHKFTGVGSDGRSSYGNHSYRSGVGYKEHGITSDDFTVSRRDSYSDRGDSYRGRGEADDKRPNDSDEELDYGSKMRTRRETNKFSSAPNEGSKLKVNIKGTTLTKVGKSNKQTVSDMDLLGTGEVDLLGGNEIVESMHLSVDSCGTDKLDGSYNLTHVQPNGLLPNDSSIGAVASSNQQGFVADFMNHEVSPSTSHQFFQSQPQSTQIQQSVQTHLPMHQSNEFHSLNSVAFETFAQSTQSHHQAFPKHIWSQLQSQQSSSTVFEATEDTDFGSFESATATNLSKSVPENKFASFGSLVDLGGLTSKSIEDAKKQQSIMNQPTTVGNSFSGLDGFAKSPTVNMISVQNSTSPHAMMHRGPSIINNQPLYGQQQMNQIQNNQQNFHCQSLTAISGQYMGVSPQGSSTVHNNVLQQHMMHQPGQLNQQGMTIQQRQQYNANMGVYYQHPGHH